MIGVKDFIIVTVSHFTNGWIQDTLKSLFQHCPEVTVLVIDNNPSINDNDVRRKSYEKGAWTYKSDCWKRHFCEAERYWLSQQPNIIMLRTDNYLQHGEAMDLANKWAYARNIKTIVHIDPDCEVKGRKWLDDLLNGVKNGYWFVSGCCMPSGILHLVPAAYSVAHSLDTSFNFGSRHPESSEPEFSKLIDSSKLYSKDFWDCSQRFWYLCAKQGKAIYIPSLDFVHLWMGSRRQHKNNILFA